MSSQVETFLVIKTQTKTHSISLSVDLNDTVYHILLIAAQQVSENTQYNIQLDCVEACHILTNTGKNKYQYQVTMSETLKCLQQRQKRCLFCDTDYVYIQFSERSFPYKYKFTKPNSDLLKYKQSIFRDFQQVEEIISSASSSLQQQSQQEDFFHISDDPVKNIENELRLTYPLPLLMPEQLIQKHYNVYLDSINTNFIARVATKPRITPIVQENIKTKDLSYFELIFRVPRPLCFIFLIPIMFYRAFMSIFQYLTSQPYFNKSAVKWHRIQPVFVIRVPIAPTFKSIAFTTLWQVIIFYLTNRFKDRSVKGLQKNYIKSYLIHYLVHVILRGNSILLTPEVISAVYMILDPLGEAGVRYHFIFDEIFRADNHQYNFGGFFRGQRAKDFLLVNREANFGKVFKFGVIGVIIELFKSINPHYVVVK
ncbi:Conserved_hypothetical protein [Hexamita inflata]|uniref:Uncharacterized protein n=1 Tax=Hexamita inflata TaxID=28002 RepID=A0ABP1JGC4_9EUKA